MTIQKNAYGELMVRYVGNRWQYIGRNRENDQRSSNDQERPDQENRAVDLPDKTIRIMAGK